MRRASADWSIATGLLVDSDEDPGADEAIGNARRLRLDLAEYEEPKGERRDYRGQSAGRTALERARPRARCRCHGRASYDGFVTVIASVELVASRLRAISLLPLRGYKGGRSWRRRH